MTDTLEQAKRTAEQWSLGQTSANYESGMAGTGAISTGKGDHGGVSYGSYQFSTVTGTLHEYLQQSNYGSQFDGLTPVTPKFDATWRELARTDPGFGKDQHDFVGRSHYGAQVAALKASGLDLADRGMAVQDAVWSTAVQFRNLTPGIFNKGMAEKFGPSYELAKLSDKDIVDAVQDYKSAHVATLFSHSPKLHDALKARFSSEKIALEHLADTDAVLKAHGVTVAHPSLDRALDSVQHGASNRDPHAILRTGSKGPEVANVQRELAALGYQHHGHPLKDDGDFGPTTRGAVEDFQRKHGLGVDGKVGNDTAEALKQATLQQSALTALTLDHPQHPGHPIYQ
jgi:type VI secretion system (T6SS) spike protein VgrG3/putative peptidoglycan binding protein